MTTPTTQTLADAREKLRAGDAMGAFQMLRPMLGYPAPSLDDDAVFSEAFATFAEIAGAVAGPELGALVRSASESPSDPQRQYDAAYALYEQRLFPIAATLLTRANRLAPRAASIVAELAACLEAMLLYGHAALVVETSGLAESDPVFAYLSGFNWIMSGDVDVARRRVGQLASVSDPQMGFMRDSLAAMVTRADALSASGVALDDRALTAWQAVLDGTALLHESPHGYDTPMHGRYAYVGDSPWLMREGIERLGALLASVDRKLSRVVAAPDRASRILALATSRHLGLPLVPWAAGAESEGLVVAWSLETVESAPFLQALRHHAPAQVLFVHASAWVEPFAYAPDVTTLLHQIVTNPFTGGALRGNPTTGQTEPAPPDTRDDETLAAEILAAPASDPSASPLDRVTGIIRTIATLSDGARPGITRTTGLRPKQRAGSPVPSNRFT